MRNVVSVIVDLANPGQFFACCGLLELADRSWKGAEGWFSNDRFFLHASTRSDISPSLSELLEELAAADLEQLNETDAAASPMHLGSPFDLRLDWWQDRRAGGHQLKVWAGSMSGVRIAGAMKQAITADPSVERMFDTGTVVRDPADPKGKKKVEPFYFDARRGAHAHPIDIGFSPNVLDLETICYPAVEFLCLVGLQRFRPRPADEQTRAGRSFEYTAWGFPLPPHGASAAVAGLMNGYPGSRVYRFTNVFRTDQRKHKAFGPGTLIKEHS